MPPEGQDFLRALESALRFLKARDRFENELRQKMAALQFEGSVIEEVIAHLSKRRLIDDRRTIQGYIRRASAKPAGRRKLEEQLTLLGAPEELVREELAGLTDDSQADLAGALLNKKNLRDRAAAGRLLTSKGFELDLVESVLDKRYGDSAEAD